MADAIIGWLIEGVELGDLGLSGMRLVHTMYLGLSPRGEGKDILLFCCIDDDLDCKVACLLLGVNITRA